MKDLLKDKKLRLSLIAGVLILVILIVLLLARCFDERTHAHSGIGSDTQRETEPVETKESYAESRTSDSATDLVFPDESSDTEGCGNPDMPEPEFDFIDLGDGTWGLKKYNGYGKEHVTIPSSHLGGPVVSIEEGAFRNCPDVKSVEIPFGVTRICSNAITGYHIEIISVPDSVTSIGDYAFNGTHISRIIIPDSVQTLGEGVFADCEQLTDVTLSHNVKVLNAWLFRNCRSLYSVVIPDSVQVINSTFIKWTGLTHIEIPASVTEFSSTVFSENPLLESITVASENPIYRSEGNCLIERSTNRLIGGCKNSVIPNTVEEIKSFAFDKCTAMTDITIPDSVKSIGTNAFYGCTGLIHVSIGSGLKKIGQEAFYGCSSLTDIVLPNSTEEIGMCAFRKCTSLSSITLGTGLKKICDYAFEDCTSLTEMVFSSSVQTLKKSIFKGCTSMTTVTFEGNGENTFIYPDAFAECHIETIYCSSTLAEKIAEIKAKGENYLSPDVRIVETGGSCKNKL